MTSYCIAFDIVCGSGKERRWFLGNGSVWLPANTRHQKNARLFSSVKEAEAVMDKYDVPFGAFVVEVEVVYK